MEKNLEDNKKFYADLEAKERNAKATLEFMNQPTRPLNWYQKQINYIHVPAVFIASSEDIGTDRARANHIDAVIHYYREQTYMKSKNMPL